MPLESALTTIANRLDEDVEEVLREAAAEVVRVAKMRVPVQTGALQRAIHVDRMGPAEYRVVAGDDDAWYGHIVEGGSAAHTASPRKGAALHFNDVFVAGEVSIPAQPPRPFLIPAFELARSHFDDRVQTEFKKWPSVERAKRAR